MKTLLLAIILLVVISCPRKPIIDKNSLNNLSFIKNIKQRNFNQEISVNVYQCLSCTEFYREIYNNNDIDENKIPNVYIFVVNMNKDFFTAYYTQETYSSEKLYDLIGIPREKIDNSITLTMSEKTFKTRNKYKQLINFTLAHELSHFIEKDNFIEFFQEAKTNIKEHAEKLQFSKSINENMKIQHEILKERQILLKNWRSHEGIADINGYLYLGKPTTHLDTIEEQANTIFPFDSYCSKNLEDFYNQNTHHCWKDRFETLKNLKAKKPIRTLHSHQEKIQP